MDIRTKTVMLVSRDYKYLVGFSILTGLLTWSDSPYDAWNTRNRSKAEKIATKIGGKLVLFNPIVNQIKTINRRATK